MNESLPLAPIQHAVLEFLRDRDDGVVFGAQAVNAYVSEPRMTQDVDVLSTRAKELAEELREHLSSLKSATECLLADFIPTSSLKAGL